MEQYEKDNLAAGYHNDRRDKETRLQNKSFHIMRLKQSLYKEMKIYKKNNYDGIKWRNQFK